MKFCTKCKLNKDYSFFGNNIQSKDGYQKYCKDCRSIEYKENKEKRLAYQNEYNRLNRDKQYAVNREWKSRNKHVTNAQGAARRAKKIRATPTWLTKEDRALTRLFYLLAKNLETATGIAHHVDHIVPLQGVTVCGLHVPWNLQVLTAEDNIRKHNRFVDDWQQPTEEISADLTTNESTPKN